MFEGKEKQSRVKMPTRPADERSKDFGEVNLGLTREEAINEAKRCLSCGCHDYGNCKLIKYADDYCVDCKKYALMKN